MSRRPLSARAHDLCGKRCPLRLPVGSTGFQAAQTQQTHWTNNPLTRGLALIEQVTPPTHSGIATALRQSRILELTRFCNCPRPQMIRAASSVAMTAGRTVTARHVTLLCVHGLRALSTAALAARCASREAVLHAAPSVAPIAPRHFLRVRPDVPCR